MKRYDLVTTPFNNLFDTFFSDAVSTPPTFFHDSAAHSWAQFRVKQKENGFVVEAELAGVKKDDLKIEVLGDTLKISGTRGSKEARDGHIEYGEFSKSFSLGADIDTDRIEAKFENGYLNLFMPHTEARKPKMIDVK